VKRSLEDSRKEVDELKKTPNVDEKEIRAEYEIEFMDKL